MQWTGVIRDGTLIEKDIGRFLSIVFELERANQLNLLPDKDLVDLCPPIEPYQVTKNLSTFPKILLIFRVLPAVVPVASAKKYC
jgi:hypothetical protein